MGSRPPPAPAERKTWGLFGPAEVHPPRETAQPTFQSTKPLPVPWVEPVDILNAILFIASDQARYITGVTSRSSRGTPSLTPRRGRGHPAAVPSLAKGVPWRSERTPS